jgi:hypothetical protein
MSCERGLHWKSARQIVIQPLPKLLMAHRPRTLIIANEIIEKLAETFQVCYLFY